MILYLCFFKLKTTFYFEPKLQDTKYLDTYNGK